MKLPKITKRTVDAVQPGERDRFLWDDELRGFGLRCRSSGAKDYFVKYRTASGRQRWLTLGQHGALTPDQARRLAQDARASVQAGRDPSGDRASKRKEVTIGELADRYYREHVLAHNKASTAREVARIIERKIKPQLGRIRITDLTRSDVKAWHQGLSAAPYEANRALAYCSKMLSLAVEDWELRADNPAKGMKRFPEKPRERYFNEEEMGRLGQAMMRLEQDGDLPPDFCLLVRLLFATGLRLGEALALRWPDVNLQTRTIGLSDAKGGARTIQLGMEAVALLADIGDRKTYVVAGKNGDAPLSRTAAEKLWAKLRAKAGIPDGRLHDIRHTVGTYAAMSGANAFVVRDLLGHKTLAMTNRYVERAAGMARTTVDEVSRKTSQALRGKVAEKEVEERHK